MRAEELAMEDCTLGVEVRRAWSETEMVCSFGGSTFPGTPDGMFESWDGTLTCVQVVRVPLVFGQTLATMQSTLAHTVLTKVVKSQGWLRATHVVPNDFIIFCWLPFPVASAVAELAQATIQQVRELDPRFSLRLRVPAQVNALFPALFACNHDVETQKTRGYSWSDVATYSGSDAEVGEDEECVWDITWGWDEDLSFTRDEQQDGGAAEEEAEADDEELDWGWDITWDWGSA